MANANGTTALRTLAADLAPIDLVTGLLNREAFELRTEVELSRAERFDRPLGLCLVEVLGSEHDGADEARPLSTSTLASVGMRILTATRLYDVACRWDERQFAILYPEASAEQALRAAVRAVLLTQQGFPELDVAAGVASHAAEAFHGVDEMVLEAIRALSEARASGHRVGIAAAAA